MVTTATDARASNAGAGSLARLADRWIYVFTAVLCIVVILVGFVPDSIVLLARVKAGDRPPLPLIVHAHAILMAAWMLLLLAQTTLMATGRGALHRQLGVAGVVIFPLLAAAMVGITKEVWTLVGSLPPSALPPEVLSGIKSSLSNTLLEQIRVVLLFPAFVAWALIVRRTDPETHKRLLMMATVLPIAAAIDRMAWLPATIPASPASSHLYALLCLAPLLVHDIVRRGRLHRAYVIGFALNAPFIVASYELWNSPWWLATAPKLMGAQGW